MISLDERILYAVIDPALLDAQPDQWGVVNHTPQPKSIGYATTLTPKVIEQATSHNIDLLITHHDAWDFMREEKEVAHASLAKHHISHIWCHEPLDKADFGTAAAFMGLLGCHISGKIVEDCGRVGELKSSLTLSEITSKLEAAIAEEPCRLHDTGRPITRVGCVTGGGMRVDYLAEALDYAIDLYITGETSLYLLEYAAFRNVSVLIYSHNGTELFGTQNLARRIADTLAIKDIIRLDEPHF